jgi:hypothetical protein
MIALSKEVWKFPDQLNNLDNVRPCVAENCWIPDHVWLPTRQLHSIVYIYTPRQPALQ